MTQDIRLGHCEGPLPYLQTREWDRNRPSGQQDILSLYHLPINSNNDIIMTC